MPENALKITKISNFSEKISGVPPRTPFKIINLIYNPTVK